MENSFVIPARPWGEAEVKFLVANADLLDEETRAELGLGGATEEVEEEDEDEEEETPIEEETPDVVIDATPAPTIEGGLPTDAEGEVVDNPTPDNA